MVGGGWWEVGTKEESLPDFLPPTAHPLPPKFFRGRLDAAGRRQADRQSKSVELEVEIRDVFGLERLLLT